MDTMKMCWITGVIFFFSTIFPIIPSLNAETVLLYSDHSVGKGDFDFSTFYVEDGIMDVFFEAGHIIFNGSFQNPEAKLPADAPFSERPSYRMAKAGGASHVLEISLHFSEDEAETLPRFAKYRFIEVSSERNLAEGDVYYHETGDSEEL